MTDVSKTDFSLDRAGMFRCSRCSMEGDADWVVGHVHNENLMYVLWCEAHNHQANALDCCVDFFGNKRGACQIVEMALVHPKSWRLRSDFRAVPVDALVIERDSDGRFPEWITDPDGPVWHQCGGTDGLLDDIAAALTEHRAGDWLPDHSEWTENCPDSEPFVMPTDSPTSKP